MKRINEMVTELSRYFLRLQCGCQNPVTYEPFQLSLPFTTTRKKNTLAYELSSDLRVRTVSKKTCFIGHV